MSCAASRVRSGGSFGRERIRPGEQQRRRDRSCKCAAGEGVSEIVAGGDDHAGANPNPDQGFHAVEVLFCERATAVSMRLSPPGA